MRPQGGSSSSSSSLHLLQVRVWDSSPPALDSLPAQLEHEREEAGRGGILMAGWEGNGTTFKLLTTFSSISASSFLKGVASTPGRSLARWGCWGGWRRRCRGPRWS